LNRLRKALVAVASVAMVAGTMGLGAAAASAASTTTSCVSRAQFIYQFDVAAGITPVYPATPDFSDVPSSSPYYGYIEAAYKAGIVNGTGSGMFSPNACLTRDQVVKIEIIALGDQSAALKDATMATSFTDDASIPSWARGYIVEAVSLGLVKGYPNGSFQPGLELSSSIAGDFIAQYQSSGKSAAFSVSASSTDAAPGAAVTLSTTGAVGIVTYSTTSGAVISGNTFVGSTPGTYTVTAASTTGQSATVKIGVYGAAAALVINLPKTVVANNMSQYTATVDVVDANGNIVGTNTDNIALSGANTSVAGVDNGSGGSGASNTVAAVNGVATFTLDAGTVAGATESLTATDTSMATNPFTANASLTTTAQVATSLSVTAPKYIEANSVNSNKIFVVVNDQTGNPMISGTYGINASLSGPATFSDGTTGPEAGAYVGMPGTFGNAGGTGASFSFNSIQSSTGAITFTASGTGLTSGTGTTTAVIAGAPAALTVSSSASSFAETAATTKAAGDQSVAGNNVTLTVGLLDSHGYPVGNPTGNVTVSVSSGGAASDNLVFSIDGGTTWLTTTNGSLSLNGTGGSIMVADSQVGADAGTYSVTISDPADAVTAAAPVSLTETAGPASVLAVSPATVNVAATSPNVTVTAQLQDAYGNNVATSGVSVSFTGSTSGSYAYTLGGVASTSGAATYTTTTGSDGSASATLKAGPYTGSNLYTVTVMSSGLTPSNSSVVSVDSTIATSVSVVTLNANSVQTSSFTAANGNVTIKATVTDQYGTPVNGDKVTYSYGTSGPITLLGTGSGGVYETSIPISLTTAGSTTITVTDNSVASAPTGSAVVYVSPAQLAGFDLIDSAGNDATALGGTETWAANTAVTFTVTPVDSFGNKTVTGTVYAVGLPTTDATGGFRTNMSAGNVSQITVPAGSAGVSVYYIDSVANSTGTNLPTDWVSYSTLSTTSGGTLTFNASTSGSWTASAGTLNSSSGSSTSWSAPLGSNGTATLTFTPSSGTKITLTLSY